MEKKGTEEDQTQLKSNSWKMDDDAFEFIDDDEREEKKNRQRGKKVMKKERRIYSVRNREKKK